MKSVIECYTPAPDIALYARAGLLASVLRPLAHAAFLHRVEATRSQAAKLRVHCARHSTHSKRERAERRVAASDESPRRALHSLLHTQPPRMLKSTIGMEP